MMNYGLKERLDYFGITIQCLLQGQRNSKMSFSIICVREKGEGREGRESKPGRIGRQKEKEGNEGIRMEERKKNTNSSVWSTEKSLHTLTSFLYYAFQSKF